ncbi:MAG: aminotransferase class V-fold PLP-dependent enzyme [Anaerolineae bacterium]|nr:aminotransferase class V-fold PLP-dependent enzyme [Anaerolineae bacterium]
MTPYRWETGTPSFETIAGTKAALEYLAEIGRLYGGSEVQNFRNLTGQRLDFKTAMTTLAAYERELVTHLIEMLKSLQGIEIAGITDPVHYHERVPTAVFTMQGHSPLEIATHLARHDIYVWDGNYYALAIMERLGKQESGGMVRVGLAHYNTHAEIDRLESALKKL